MTKNHLSLFLTAVLIFKLFHRRRTAYHVIPARAGMQGSDLEVPLQWESREGPGSQAVGGRRNNQAALDSTCLLTTLLVFQYFIKAAQVHTGTH